MGTALAVAAITMAAGAAYKTHETISDAQKASKRAANEQNKALLNAMSSVNDTTDGETTAKDNADKQRRAIAMNETQTKYSTALGAANEETDEKLKKKTLLGG